MTELKSAQVDGIQQRISALHDGREAHAKLLGGRESAVDELEALAAKRATVQARIAAREKEIAISNAPLPAAPFPEEAEIALLDRGIRIHRMRVGEWDQQVRQSQQILEGLVLELNEAWNALGISLSESLALEFCETASHMGEIRTKMIAVTQSFPAVEKLRWIFFPTFAVCHPRTAELIINPVLDRSREKWPMSTQTLLSELEALRDQVKAAKE